MFVENNGIDNKSNPIPYLLDIVFRYTLVTYLARSALQSTNSAPGCQNAILLLPE